MYRYLALIWNPTSADSAGPGQLLAAALASRATEWSIAYQAPGALVAHSGLRDGSSQAYPLRNNCGVVLGNVFSRRCSDYQTRHKLAFDDAETRAIVTTSGQHLIDEYWGPYVALIFDGRARRYHVFREPTGNLPCYRTNHKGATVLFSHVEDCVRFLPVSFTINRNYLTRWLVFGRSMWRECGLQDVEDIPGGERLTFLEDRITRTLVWNPAEIARRPSCATPEAAASELRRTVQTTIDAWASCYDRITHKLSGGLDSSIVAGCLAKAPSQPQTTYLNFCIDVNSLQERLQLPGVDKRTADNIRAIAGDGDERHFARLVAAKWQHPLLERRRMASIDLTRLWHVPLMISPPMFFTTMEMEDVEIEIVEAHKTQAFFSGQTGDSVFLATGQPLPAIDYAHLHGIGPDLWQHVLSTSALSKHSVWAVLGKVVKHGLLRRPYHSTFRRLEQPTFLRPDLLRQLSDSDFESHWDRLASQSYLPPGKRSHIRGLSGSAYYDFVFQTQRIADHVDPLNSQPIWELLLKLPTYTILHGGVSRGLARLAFADILPDEIRKRQVKASGTSFYQQVVRKNSEFLRASLSDGLLVQEGYLDREKVHEYFDSGDSFLKFRASQVLSYLAAEVWLQKWKDARHKTAPVLSSIRTR